MLLAAALALGVGCDSGEEGGPSARPAVIVVQPADEAVFEGQAGFFRVFASGTDGLGYQWLRNGVLIEGATDSHLETQGTVPGDDGTTYSVLVTNTGAAPVSSRAARLTVRPPLDLRFQWVDAPYRPTYVIEMNLLGGSTLTWSGAGSPLLVGSAMCGASFPLNCSWEFAVDPVVPGMTIAYSSGPIAALATDWASALPSDTVVTSLDLEEVNGAYAMSLGRTTQAGDFTAVQGSVAPDQLEAIASSEGASGRVLTAVSFQGGLVSYVSYGWSRAASATYEAKVILTTFDALPTDAASLAAEGYVITAFGAGNEGANGLVLVGTRAPGNTAPRSLSVVTPSFGRPQVDGYAIVGYYFDAAVLASKMILEQ